MPNKLPPSPPPIAQAQRLARLDALRRRMDEAGVATVLLGATASLRYFTGMSWHPSERFCGALVHADRLEYVAPRFELDKVAQIIGVPGEIPPHRRARRCARYDCARRSDRAFHVPAPAR